MLQGMHIRSRRLA